MAGYEFVHADDDFIKKFIENEIQSLLLLNLNDEASCSSSVKDGDSEQVKKLYDILLKVVDALVKGVDDDTRIGLVDTALQIMFPVSTKSNLKNNKSAQVLCSSKGKEVIEDYTIPCGLSQLLQVPSSSVKGYKREEIQEPKDHRLHGKGVKFEHGQSSGESIHDVDKFKYDLLRALIMDKNGDDSQKILLEEVIRTMFGKSIPLTKDGVENVGNRDIESGNVKKIDKWCHFGPPDFRSLIIGVVAGTTATFLGSILFLWAKLS